MAEKNSTRNKSSRYTAGGTSEVSSWGIEWWERTPLKRVSDDFEYIVPKLFEGRLDLISALFLQEPRYWWFIAQYNNILDPFSEVREGTVLYIPPKSAITARFSGSIGGVKSTRTVQPTILPVV